MTKMLNADKAINIQKAALAIKAGEVVAFPTDTVYGLGANFTRPEAIDQLYTIKARDPNKPIAVLIGSLEQLPLLSQNIHPHAQALIQKFWPGALTLVVPKKPGLPESLSSSSNIGVRMPAHPVALALIALSGPLAATSANLSGGENCTTAEQVLFQLRGRVSLILDGGKCQISCPSTVVDCTGRHIRILREGAISAAELGL